MAAVAVIDAKPAVVAAADAAAATVAAADTEDLIGATAAVANNALTRANVTEVGGTAGASGGA